MEEELGSSRGRGLRGGCQLISVGLRQQQAPHGWGGYRRLSMASGMEVKVNIMRGERRGLG